MLQGSRGIYHGLCRIALPEPLGLFRLSSSPYGELSTTRKGRAFERWSSGRTGQH
jgi:hypothetical protein